MFLNTFRKFNKRLHLNRDSRLLPSLLLCGTWILFFTQRQQSDTQPVRSSITDRLVSKWHMEDTAHGGVPFFNKKKWSGYSSQDLVPWAERLYSIDGSRFGDEGKAVTILDEETKLSAARLRSKHQLNVVVSNMVPLNRTLPEVRNPSCLSKRYPSRLPSVSVIIVFHNEAPSTILRTAVSAIDRSPRGVLKEVLFVDDASTNDDLREEFLRRVDSLQIKARVLRLPQREGLIAARLTGARAASGAVLFFMDAHMELSPGWSEPLLSELLSDRTKIVAPVIDDIDDEDFSYKRVQVDQMRGGFNWKLRHVWIEPFHYDKIKSVDPFPTPTIIGGVFAIDREYFFESGAFDPGMKIWGGENIEISLRIWRCGGSMLIVPCSRVGHVYRKKSPHFVPGGFNSQLETEGTNIGRCAKVWLDDYYDFYTYMNPRNLELGDLSSRMSLKKGCHDMNWYLSTVYPDSPLPTKYIYLGQIKTKESKECLDGIGSNGEEVGVRLCHGLGSYQTFMFKDSGQIQCDVHCLSPSSKSPHTIVKKPCSIQDEDQKWTANTNGQIIHSRSGKCLEFESKSEEDGSSLVVRTSPKSVLNYLADLTKKSLMVTVIPGPTLRNCDLNRQSQLWTMDNPTTWIK